MQISRTRALKSKWVCNLIGLATKLNNSQLEVSKYHRPSLHSKSNKRNWKRNLTCWSKIKRKCKKQFNSRKKSNWVAVDLFLLNIKKHRYKNLMSSRLLIWQMRRCYLWPLLLVLSHQTLTIPELKVLLIRLHPKSSLISNKMQELRVSLLRRMSTMKKISKRKKIKIMLLISLVKLA